MDLTSNPETQAELNGITEFDYLSQILFQVSPNPKEREFSIDNLDDTPRVQQP